MFISICLPVYNMEKYLEKALLSIINQSFQNFEIIIVNDNSEDNTEKIIYKYQNNFNIKYIKHLKNLGVYKSRIDGALNAESKYCIILKKILFINLNYQIYYSIYLILRMKLH